MKREKADLEPALHTFIFEFVPDPASAEDAIHLLALGTHGEVY